MIGGIPPKSEPMGQAKHPFSKPEAGDIIAIGLGSGEHGYVSIHRGRVAGVYPLISTGLIRDMETIRQYQPKWFFTYFYLGPQDKTPVLNVGKIELVTPLEQWGPPRFIPKDIFHNFNKIVDHGMRRPATDAEIAGLQQARNATPQSLQKFIREHGRECTSLKGVSEPVQYAAVDSEEDEEPAGNIFLEVVFRSDDFPFAGRDIPEDALLEALHEAGIGDVTGGGGCPQFSNIDIEVTDFERGLAVIRKTLKKIGAPVSTEIHRYRPEHVIYRLD